MGEAACRRPNIRDGNMPSLPVRQVCARLPLAKLAAKRNTEVNLWRTMCPAKTSQLIDLRSVTDTRHSPNERIEL